MQYAICLQPYIPMRFEASERSEMINQLLFGDTYVILEEGESWCRIKRDCDDYEGWIDYKTVTILTEREYVKYGNETVGAPLLRAPFSMVQKTTQGVTMGAYLSWGSRIFNIDETGVMFTMQNHRFEIAPSAYVNPVSASSMSRQACAKYIQQTAQSLLNVPYLWGGCSAFGVDCSGFIQTLFRFIGIILPRDASLQAECGTNISFDDRLPGDLAFFSRNGKIVHVGLVAEHSMILHASGALHYDELRAEGIYSSVQQKITHELAFVKRFF